MRTLLTTGWLGVASGVSGSLESPFWSSSCSSTTLSGSTDRFFSESFCGSSEIIKFDFDILYPPHVFVSTKHAYVTFSTLVCLAFD